MSTVAVSSDLDFVSVSRIVNLPDPTAAQHPATKAYVDSTVEGLNWKDSVRVASTANVNIASPGATIDGITMTANDRALLKNQTAGAENGGYIWNGAAVPMTRSLDMSTAAEVEAAVVYVEEGTTNANTTWRQTVANPTLGTTALSFTAFGTAASAASETTAGIAEIATQTETDTGTDDLRFVTPLKLATYSGRKKKYTQTFGDGSATSYVITHNLGTDDYTWDVRETGGSKRSLPLVELQHTSSNSCTVIFNVAPASSGVAIVLIA